MVILNIFSMLLFRKEAFIINKLFNSFFIILILITFFISIFFIPFCNSNAIKIIDFVDSDTPLWPAPRYI